MEGRKVDWEHIHRRLAEMQAKLDRGWSADEQETRRVLRERARALARETSSPPFPGETIEVLEFAIAQARYGIETVHIREVTPAVALTPVPCTPPFVAGLVSLRGQVFSVLDLAKFLGLAPPPPAERVPVIVLCAEDMLVGVLATAIFGLRRVSRQELETSLPTLAGRAERYLTGVSRGRVAILDAYKLLSDGEIVVNEEVA